MIQNYLLPNNQLSICMKIICIGRNYSEHAKELNNDVPSEPVVFMKPKSALLQPDKPFIIPDFTKDLHYECELVVKIGKNGKYIQEKFASKYYNEISVGIDFTARDLQQQQKSKGLPWEIAKAFDNSAVVGHFISLNENRKIDDINFSMKKNGELVQQGNSSQMLFSVDKIIAYVSQFFTLNISDLIFTGTPAGVGTVAILDELEGFLEDEKMFDLSIQ